MTNHRRDVRPRYGRIGLLAAAVTISAVAALAGFGVLATSTARAGAGPKPAAYSQPTTGSTVTPVPDQGSDQGSDVGGQRPDPPDGQDSSTPARASSKAVPIDSGTGRRIVFSQSLQRVWLVGQQADDVQKTYLVSGSVTHNLQPGTYSVYSRSRWAVGIDDSGVMQYFVRFTQGPTGAAIGFHSIPTKNGEALQTRAQLGTPQSHGCIRQYLPDAVALWDFAPVGTKVVVVA